MSPQLDPKSDTKFFGKDYPHDKSPSASGLKFDHPYPHVQDSGDFEKDYVKDENGDSGAWKSQMEYDTLRGKLRQEKKNAQEALAEEKKQQEELDKVIREKEEAYQKIEDTKDKADKIEKEQEAAEHASEEAKKKQPDLPADAADDTQKAITNLEDCKEQLRKARSELSALLSGLADAKKAEEAKEKLVDERGESVTVAENAVKAAEKKVSQEDTELQSAEQDYEAQKEKTDKLQADLKAAAKKVQAYRQKADADGGVYPSESAAPALASPLLGSLLVALLTLLASW